MSYLVLSALLVVMAAIVAIVLNYFGNRMTYPWYVQVACFVSYFFPFTIILVLPLDLASTRFRDCSDTPGTVIQCDQPLAYVSEEFLYGFWEVVYWITFNIQMFVVPIMQGYVRSGELSFRGRLWSGIKDNIIFYCICGGIGSIFILYAIFGLNISATYLLTFAIPATNAYGLLLLTVFMGYGLVEVPRGLWYNASVTWVLCYLEAQVPKFKEACVDSEAEIYEIARFVGYASRKIGSEDELRPLVDTLMEKCPLALQQRNVGNEDDDLPATLTRAKLIDLHARIKRAIFLSERDQALLRYLEHHAFLCQDIMANYESSNRRFKSAFVSISETDKYMDLKLQAYWWWYVWIKPVAMRSLSVMCVIASFLIIWSESTFQITSVKMSIPALIVEPGNISYGLLEILAVAFICYMCTCTYFTLLSINVFEYYKMVPEHHTDESSLLFVGAYLCKLTFPLCYNFLNMGGLADGVTHSNSTKVDYSSSPVFIQYFGPAVNLTPLFGAGYNDWVAHLVLIMCVIIVLNLHGKILRFFRMENYFYETIKPNAADLEEGKSIIMQARALEERRLQCGGAVGDQVHGRYTQSRPRARNTRDLLDRYKNRKPQESESNTNRFTSSRSGAASGSSTIAGTRDNGATHEALDVTGHSSDGGASNSNPQNTSTLFQGLSRVTGLFSSKGSSSGVGGASSGYQRLKDGKLEENSASGDVGGLRTSRKFGVASSIPPSSTLKNTTSRTAPLGSESGGLESWRHQPTSSSAENLSSTRPAQGTKAPAKSTSKAPPAKRGGLFDDL
ncbi:hypothetical protein BASA83_001095 [Batrachochytrium salamandrivorans]|nr:hypothetical protein BASA83_001095 [Batrachochytrium salamandrivorans]